jgi:ribosomal protein S18 acetylase RimI-like enzyme
MAGLLADVLPWAYSRGNALQRALGGLLADPAGTAQQSAGLLGDNMRSMNRLAQVAYGDPNSPLPTNKQAGNALMDAVFANAIGFAPAGMIDVKALGAKYPDVDFNLMQRGDGGLATLSKVVVPPAQRGQGVGSSFMRDLTEAADADRATLALSPSSDFGGSKARLIEFYRRFGFVPNKGRNIDYEISESMYRTPR